MARKIIPNLIALVLAVLFTESLFCLIPVRALDQSRPHHQTFCRYDPLLGWWHVPGRKARYATDEYSVELEFNSQGVRGPEYAFDKPPGTYRVLVLGDSFAEGYSAPFSHVFSEYLRRYLEERLSRPVEVINAGIGGFSTDQEMIFYKARGARYRPDLTIVLFYFNDVLANSQPGFHRGYKPVFSLDNEGKLVLKNVPVPKPASGYEEETEEAAFWTLPKTRALLGAVARNIPVLPWLNPKKQREDMRLQEGAGASAEKGAVPAEYFAWNTVGSPVINQSWAMTEVILRQFKEETARTGSGFLVFYVPEKASIYPKIWDSLKLKYGLAAPLWDITHDDRMLEGICRRNNIDCVNPLPPYADETMRLSAFNKGLFYDIDEHWNIRGHEFTGRLLADVIMEKYFPDGTKGHAF